MIFNHRWKYFGNFGQAEEKMDMRRKNGYEKYLGKIEVCIVFTYFISLYQLFLRKKNYVNFRRKKEKTTTNFKMDSKVKV